MNKPVTRRRALGAILAAATATSLLAACAVGPRYVRPKVQLPVDFVEAHSDGYDQAHPVASRLWHSFGDPVLDALIDAALARNKTLAQATAQLNEARALR
jgi:outer membrane protein TolC